MIGELVQIVFNHHIHVLTRKGKNDNKRLLYVERRVPSRTPGGDNKHGADKRAQLRRNQLVLDGTIASLSADFLNQTDIYVDVLRRNTAWR